MLGSGFLPFYVLKEVIEH